MNQFDLETQEEIEAAAAHTAKKAVEAIGKRIAAACDMTGTNIRRWAAVIINAQTRDDITAAVKHIPAYEQTIRLVRKLNDYSAPDYDDRAGEEADRWEPILEQHLIHIRNTYRTRALLLLTQEIVCAALIQCQREQRAA